MVKATFEDKIDIINNEIAKRKNRWRFAFVHDVDYDDVKQILLLHIYKKWDKWDQERPLEKWVGAVIEHQINNLIRNNFGKLAPPCYNCSYNAGGESCLHTKSGTKCSECPLYKKWAKTKQGGYNMKMAGSIDLEVYSEKYEIPCEPHQEESYFNNFHEKIKPFLTDRLYKVYDLLYIQGMDEDKAAIELGFKTSEQKRKPGYKQISNMKKEIIEIVKKQLPTFDIDS